ncbi:MAG: aminoglycoside 6-adenylyltransferase, partial [Cytophagales bacterium]|nr:aminoglycoside 6-adenylyltransferase [Cytophagales bacterium]
MKLIINERTKQSIEIAIKNIKDRSFDERDISDLFKEIRPYSKEYDLINELADFLVHREEKNKGIAHKAFNINYSKLQFVHANHDHKKIDLRLIPIELFDNLIRGSVESIPEKILLTKLNKN